VLEHLGPRQPRFDVSFVGQIAADHPLHAHRERLLDALLTDVDVAIFSPSGATRPPAAAGVVTRRLLYAGTRALRRAGVSEATVRRLPLVGRAAGWPAPPRGAPPARVPRALRPGGLGRETDPSLRDSP